MKYDSRAFTIVELLIVIVVIAILAAISIVAYNGIQERSRASAATSAASQAKKKLELFKIDNSEQYPLTGNLASAGITNSGNTYYQYTSDGSNFCLTASNSGTSYNVSNTTTPSAGACSGQVDGGMIINYATSPHATTGWTSATPTGSSTTYVSNGASDGGSAYQVTTTQAGQVRIKFPQSLGVMNEGEVNTISVDIFSPVSTTAVLEMGISSGSGNTYPNSGSISISPGWNRYTRSVTVPSGVSGNVFMNQFTTTASQASGQIWKASRAMSVKGSYSTGYADGASADWSWSGTTNNSTSTGPPL